VLPFGQAISRTTYAAYFAMVGTTYGAGDGSTTFNVIDKRGRVSAGKDDMGGSAANRITAAGSGITGTTLGSAGGAETVTLAQNALPNISPTFTGIQQTVSANEGAFKRNAIVPGTNDLGGGSATYTAATPSFTFTPSGTISSINGGVTQTAVNKMPPAIVVNYILRIL
jgi:microcystin-dependent protein